MLIDDDSDLDSETESDEADNKAGSHAERRQLGVHITSNTR